MDDTTRVSRRTMLVTLAGGGTAAVAIAAPAFSNQLAQQVREAAVTNGWARQFFSLANAGFTEWRQQVGSIFLLGGGFRMKLVAVTPLSSKGKRPSSVGRSSAFIAVFDPVGNAAVPGDLIHTARHPQYGTLPIFLSAAPTAKSPRRMVAVFN
ncbi:MAG: hypothetical protein ACK4K7_02750 [Allosphingosinicella sp.]|uniref:hypothetical protein n=1 Tax=Allosphingosinicella sp. TaxID=2823234 RepID=UPI0039483450